MKGITTFFVGIAAVVGLGANGLHAVEGLIKGLVPNISIPHVPTGIGPALKRAPAAVAPPVVAPAPVAGKKGTARIAGGAAKAIPLVAGAYAGNELANRYGDSMPGSTGMISQKPGDCYIESPDGYHHVPCSELKRKGKK